VVLGIMIFVRQAFLDHELLRLLSQSQESFANLKRLQVQITESEKLASIGQLVGGAAHELNNPIAAMLGYSDLLLNTPLNSDQQALATRIGQQIRRTKSLVASLLSFAKQSPVTLTPINLTTLLVTAVRMSQPQRKSLHVEVETDFEPNMPLVMGDSNQLLQVCVQMLNSAINAVDQQNGNGNGKELRITLRQARGIAVIRISDRKYAEQEPATAVADAAFEDSSQIGGPLLSGLGACRSILQQHRGRMVTRHDSSQRFDLRVELPIIPATKQSLAHGDPAMWPSQPFA
jgi:two-component system NtrC family sensor kinase